MTELEALQLLIKKKELGITDDEIGALVAKCSKMHQSASVPDLKPEELVKPPSLFDEMSDEEIQYYATPFYDELMAKKAKQTEIKENHEATNG